MRDDRQPAVRDTIEPERLCRQQPVRGFWKRPEGRVRPLHFGVAVLIVLLGGMLLLPACSSTSAEEQQTAEPSMSLPASSSTAGEGGAVSSRLLRGIFDDAWVNADDVGRHRIVTEMAGKLHVQVVRIDLRWNLAEPAAAGQYDGGYISHIQQAVDAARSVGMKVIIDVFGVPQWASNSSFWNKPPAGYQRGYQPFYPVAASHLADWGKTAAYLARTFNGKVSWWECWNEPNLSLYMYPQTTSSDSRFAAHQYMELLKPFYAAVRGADPRTKVLAGVTAPFGINNKTRTAPQKFLADLKALKVTRYCDGISHHPYTPAGVTPMPAPLAKPQFAQFTLTLGNIGTLLRMFPKEAFYLTEYGYPTKSSTAWGAGSVSEKTQAQYLTTAYRYVAKLKQVKMLNWFLWKDIDAGKNRPENAFFGLRRANGTKKPSWSAYAALR